MKSGGIFCLDGKDVRAESDTVVVYDGETKEEYGADGEIFVCDWIRFDTSGDSEFFDALEIPSGVLLRYTDAEFISSTIRNIEDEFYSVRNKRAKMIDSLLKALLIKISESVPTREIVRQNADPYSLMLTELREKIYRTPQLKWNVDSMAADVNMSRSYFQRIYHELFGVSCMSDVISSKIEKAKEVLTGTTCTVNQVAAMCGYDNEEHFMRQFKKIVGMTPTAYRKNKY
jgi:AraC family transcriptional regulator of arabinose operon